MHYTSIQLNCYATVLQDCTMFYGLWHCSRHLCQHSNMELPDHSSAVPKDCVASFFTQTHTHIFVTRTAMGTYHGSVTSRHILLVPMLDSTFACVTPTADTPTVHGLQPCLIQTVPAKHGHLSNKVSGWHLCKSPSRETQTPSKDKLSCLTGASVESSYQETNIQYLALCKQKNAFFILRISTISRCRKKLIFRQKHFTV